MTLPPPTPPYGSFTDAARAALEHLQAEHGMGLWMITRTTGDDWVVVEAADDGYGVTAGDHLRWSDSFCSRMVRGEGPPVAPDARAVPAYAEAPIARQKDIGAYIGVPLHTRDGELFGTLCAIDPQPQDERLAAAGREAALLARMLSTILAHEIEVDAQSRRAEVAELAAEADGLTQLPNRRAWERLLGTEEARCRRYGVSAAVCFVDLDGLKDANDRHGHAEGDRLLRRAAESLVGAARPFDVVARVGGDEFALLLLDCDRVQAEAIAQRLRDALRDAGIRASLGVAPRPARGTLSAAVEMADAAMYAQKRDRRAAGV